MKTTDSVDTNIKATPQLLRHDHRLWLVMLLAGIFYALGVHAFQVGAWYDDALYITLAKSIAQGQGFRRIELFGAPQTSFVPFGYPLLLAPLVWLFPTSYLPLQMLSLALALATIMLLWYYLNRREEVLVVIAVTALYGLHPATVGHATMVMTEIAFLCFTFMTLVLLDHYEDGAPLFGWIWLVMICSAAMTYFIRITGLTLITAIGFYLLARQRWARAFAFGIPVATAIGLWSLRNLLVVGSPISDEYVRIAGRAGLEGYLSQLLGTAVNYAILVPDMLLPLFSPRLVNLLGSTGSPLILVYSLIIWCFLVVGFLTCMRRSFNVVQIYVVLLGALLLVWGYPQGRYLLPILPFLYLFLVTGTLKIAQWLLPHLRLALPPHLVLMGFVAVVMLLILARNVQGLRNPLRERIPDVSLGSSWIREHTPHDAVIMARVPRVSFIYSDRSTVAYPPESPSSTDVDTRLFYPNDLGSAPAEAMLWAINRYGVDYLLISPPLITSEGSYVADLDTLMKDVVLATIKNHPERFDAVYTNIKSQVFVYKVLPAWP